MPLIPIIPPTTSHAKGGAKVGTAAYDAAAPDKRVPLSKIVRDAGWRGQAAKDAMALTFPESGADPFRENTDADCGAPGENAVGLFQICLVHRGKMGIPRDISKARTWLKDAQNNANVAYKIWLGAGRTFAKDWEAWGKHTAHYGKDPLITVEKRGGIPNPVDLASDAVDAALGPLDEIGSALLSPSTWFRAGKGALGGAMVVLGTGALVFIVANRASGGKVARTAKTAGTVAVTKKLPIK